MAAQTPESDPEHPPEPPGDVSGDTSGDTSGAPQPKPKPEPQTAADAPAALLESAAEAARSAIELTTGVAGTAADLTSRAAGAAVDMTTRAAGTAADLTVRAAGTAADLTVRAAGTAADLTARAAGTAADVTFEAATVAAHATIRGATWTARLMAWLLARMPMRQIIWLGVSLVVLLLALIGLAIWVFGWLWNPQVNLERWRSQAQTTLSQAVGRTVTIADMRVTVGKSPELRVRGLAIANAPGFSGVPLLSVDEAVLQVTGEVSDFTRAASDARLVVQRASLRGVRLSLENRPQGNNWTLGPPGQPDRAARESFLAALPLAALSRLVVEDAGIEDLQVRMTGLRGDTSTWVLPGAQLRAPAGEPVRFSARGERCAKGQPCSVQADSGSLADLARVDRGELTDWPLNLMVAWGDRVAAFNGALRLRSVAGVVSAAAPRIEQDLADAGVRLRGPLPAAIGADFELTAQSLMVRSLTATFGAALATGQWQADWALDVDARPSFKAALDISGLDDMLEGALPPRAGGGAAAAAARPGAAARPAPAEGGLRRLYDSLAAFEIDPALLKRADAQMTLRMDRFDALGVAASASQATVTLVAGQLWAPMATTLWGVPFQAEVQIDAATQPPTLQVDLQSRAAALGPLVRGALGTAGIEGRAGQLRLALATRGDNLAQWLRALDLKLDLGDTEARYGDRSAQAFATATAATSATAPASRPVNVQIRSLALRLPSLQPLTGALDAQLLGRPLRATLSGSTLEQFMRAERSRFALSARSDELSLDLQALVAAPLARADDEFSIALRAPRAAALAAWLGLDAGARPADAPLSLEATVRRSRGAAGVEAFALTQPLVLRLGASELRVKAAPGARSGLTDIDVDIPRLRLADLDLLRPRAAPAGGVESPARSAGGADSPARTAGLSLDIPVLPQRISFADADVAVHLREIEGAPLELRALEFRGELRDGHLPTAPLSLSLEGKPVRGAIALDLRSDEPQASLWLAAEQPDIGHLLRRLGLQTGLQLRFESISLHLQARAARLGDMLARSSVAASVSGGQLLLRDAALGRDRVVDLRSGTVSAQPGGSVTLALDGRIDGEEARLTLRSGSLSQLADTRTPIGLSLRADLAGSAAAGPAGAAGAPGAPGAASPAGAAPWVEIGAQFARDLRAPRGQLQLRAGGARLDALNRASGLKLPPWGPWSLQGLLQVAPGRYDIESMRLTVGGSTLGGSVSVALPAAGATAPAANRPASRPAIHAVLRAPQIQLDDFPTQGWSALAAAPTASAPAATASTVPAGGTDTLARARAQTRRGADAGDALLAAGSLERVDLSLDLALDRVMSGRERLGAAQISLRLADGDLRLDPARLELPGGTARMSLAFVRQGGPGPVQRRAQLDLNVPELDYGVIASRLPMPGAAGTPRGRLSLAVQASATTAELHQLIERGSGQIDLMLWPQDLRSERIDLWVNNLFTAILPAVDRSDAPQVNCAVLRARLERGVLRPQSLLLDTSAMRVRGQGSVDLLAGRYALRFEPQAKQAQFFSLATPVEVSGPLDAPQVVLSSGDIAQTALRFATSVFWVPIMKLAGQRMASDGADVCVRAAPSSAGAVQGGAAVPGR